MPIVTMNANRLHRVPMPLRAEPTVLLQHVVERLSTTEDGFIVRAVSIPWLEIQQVIARDPDALHRFTPDQWEEIIAAAYDRAGFDEVILTPRSGDLGRDVIATKHGFGCVRIIEQVKAYKPGHLVTANDVRALMGVLDADRAASKGIVTTTSGFAPRIETDKYIRPLMPTRLELRDGPQLRQWLEQVDSTGHRGRGDAE